MKQISLADYANNPNILKGFTNAEEIIEKGVSDYFDNYLEKGGKRATIGEKRTWSGKEYEKTQNGWKLVKKDKVAKKENNSEEQKKTNIEFSVDLPSDLKSDYEKANSFLKKDRIKNIDGIWDSKNEIFDLTVEMHSGNEIILRQRIDKKNLKNSSQDIYCDATEFDLSSNYVDKSDGQNFSHSFKHLDGIKEIFSEYEKTI